MGGRSGLYEQAHRSGRRRGSPLLVASAKLLLAGRGQQGAGDVAESIAQGAGHRQIVRGRGKIGIGTAHRARAVGHLIALQGRHEIAGRADDAVDVHPRREHRDNRELDAAMLGGGGTERCPAPLKAHQLRFQPVLQRGGHIAEIARGTEHQGIGPLELAGLWLGVQQAKCLSGPPLALILADHVLRLEVRHPAEPDLITRSDGVCRFLHRRPDLDLLLRPGSPAR